MTISHCLCCLDGDSVFERQQQAVRPFYDREEAAHLNEVRCAQAPRLLTIDDGAASSMDTGSPEVRFHFG